MNTKIKLLKPHRHDGRDFAAGDVLDVPPAIAEWLVSKQLAETAPADKAPAPAAAKPAAN